MSCGVGMQLGCQPRREDAANIQSTRRMRRPEKQKKKHIPHEPVTLRLFFSLGVTPRLATEFSSVLSYALLRYG